MKKIICFILVLIIILTPLNIVKATEAIELTQASIDLLNNGIDFLSYSGSVPYGFLPFVFSSEKNYQNVLESMMQKQDVFIVDGNANIQIRPLSENEYGLLENAYIYDDEGNIVSLQELYYGEVDNGYFTEKFYCKNDGTIVYQDDEKANPYIDVKFGGSELSYIDWQNTYSDLYDDLTDNSFNYSLEPNLEPYSVYINIGYYWNANTKYAGYIFIPSGFVDGKTVYLKESNQLAIYTNDLNSIYWSQYYPSGSNNFINITNGSFSVNGETYERKISFSPLFSTDITNISLSTYDAFSNTTTRGNYVFDRLNYNNNVSILSSDDVVSYQKVQANSDTIDFTNSYSYGSLSDYMDTLEGVQSYPNVGFDSTDAITGINYPFIFDIDTAVPDVAIPFPDSVAIDDTPAIDYPLEETIDPSLITPNIPIISDLKNKFPFSIPWDIANLLKGLEAQRTTPYIDTDVTIPGINYTWHIEYDLSDFDGTAELFRTLFLIAFIIGLAYFSYDHFFGS